MNEKRRTTRQRTAIADALRAAGAFRSAQDLHDDLRARGARVGLATVYRQLHSLARAGEVDVLRNAEGEAIYRMCESDEHHHHLVCTECGRSVEVGSAEVEKWATSTANRHGFTSVTHTAELYGVCGDCGR